MKISHISKEIFYKQPFGAVPCDTSVLLRCAFSTKPSKPILKLRFEAVDVCERFSFSASSVIKQKNSYIAEFNLTSNIFHKPGVYFYKFTSETKETSDEFQITVYEKDLGVPDWFLNTVIYQIFPDRFYKANDERVIHKPNTFIYSDWNDTPVYIKSPSGDIVRWEFFGGNLKGIEEKLTYIQELGADTLYLNPIFEAASNHRYDTADYMKVDSMLGGDDAFDDLIAALKKDNMHVILDGVFNHTGRNSKYFKNCQNIDSPYRNWYVFHDDGSYDCWWGVKDLPALNKSSESFADFIATSDNSVIKYWSRKGIDGWRLDVADELTDVFLQKIRKAAEEVIEEPVIMGEVWEDASHKVSYGERKTYFSKPELHTHTNYVFRNTIVSYFKGEIDGRKVSDIFEEIKENYPRHNFLAQVNMTGSHDVKRLMTLMLEVSRYNRNLAKNLVKAFSLIQFVAPGVPLIYYGDEVCLEGDVDPDNRRTYPWNKQDIHMIEWFSELIAMRKSDKTFVYGDAEYYTCDNHNAFALLRRSTDGIGKKYLVVCDRFGRGMSYLSKCIDTIAEKIDIILDKDYIVEKDAGGYAVLVSFDFKNKEC